MKVLQSAIQLLQPLNKEEEKQKFLFDKQYNPQFVYEKTMDPKMMRKYGSISDEYLPLALSILKKGVEIRGEEESFLELVEGGKIDRQQVEKNIIEYLKKYGLERKMQIHFSKRFLSPTSVTWPYINIRLPIIHRERGIIYTLHHEIGTHVFRRLNDERQPWYEKREAYHLHQPYETEEGLAVINAHIFRSHPLLWQSALYYYSVYHGSRMSFSELYKDLRQYTVSEDSRWSMCMRIKRGIQDTSVPGAFSKDQIYLRGVIKVLRWLKAHTFDPRPLYIGKIAVEDVEVAQHLNPQYIPLLPSFLQEDAIEEYKKRVHFLIEENSLHHILNA
ncbi:MAG: DUF1704 domain-containing protein [Candidatus Pacebacteria bacterium]|nr:DUF1704 domain-containing protein [Candidatus Paceibacterota bacterium]